MAGRFGGALVVASLVLVGCHSSKPKAGPVSTETPVTLVTQNPCSLTTVPEVDRIFAGVATATKKPTGCLYDLGKVGTVRFSVRRADTHPLLAIMPSGQLVPGVGQQALWAPLAAGHGGVLVVRAGKADLQIEAVLPGAEVVAKSRAIGWAATILPRLAKSPGIVAEVARVAIDDPCDLLTPAQRLTLFGKKAVPGGHDSSTCEYRTATGATISIGPLREPATGQDLLAVRHIDTVDGKSTDWPLTPLKGAGDAAVVQRDPNQAGIVEVYVLSGARLLKVQVGAPTTAAATKLARSVAVTALAGL